VIGGWTFDWTTSAALATITLLDGVRRTWGDSINVRKVFAGPWTILGSSAEGRKLTLASWCAPFVLHLTFRAPSRSCSMADGVAVAHQLSRVRATVGVLRIVGAIDLVGLVLGVPIATARYASWGFVSAISGVVFVAIAIAITTSLTLRRVGLARSRAMRLGARCLSPFVAPQAPEIILQHIVGVYDPLAVLERMVDAGIFRAWLRPRAHDWIAGRPRQFETERALPFSDAWLAQLVDTAPSGVCGSYCPRCGCIYRPGPTTCVECDGIPLARVDSGADRVVHLRSSSVA
jgi:hypothetical protein